MAILGRGRPRGQANAAAACRSFRPAFQPTAARALPTPVITALLVAALTVPAPGLAQSTAATPDDRQSGIVTDGLPAALLAPVEREPSWDASLEAPAPTPLPPLRSLTVATVTWSPELVPPPAPERTATWRNTFGAERMSPPPRLRAAADLTAADVVLIAGLPNLRSARALFPARSHFIVLPKAVTATDGAGGPAIVIRRGVGIRATAVERPAAGVPGTMPLPALATRLSYPGGSIWAAVLPDRTLCFEDAGAVAPCGSDQRTDTGARDWLAGIEARGEGVIAAAALTSGPGQRPAASTAVIRGPSDRPSTATARGAEAGSSNWRAYPGGDAVGDCTVGGARPPHLFVASPHWSLAERALRLQAPACGVIVSLGSR